MVAARLMPNLLDEMEPSGSPDEGQNAVNRVCGQGDVVIIPVGTDTKHGSRRDRSPYLAARRSRCATSKDVWQSADGGKRDRVPRC